MKKIEALLKIDHDLMKKYFLKGERIDLSNDLDIKYAPTIADLANDIDVIRNVGGHGFHFPYREEDALNFFTMNRDEGKRFFAIDFLIFFNGSPAGIIGLSDIDYTDRKCHVGYWIGKKYWGKGIASEALSMITDFAHGEISMHRIYTGVLEFNSASMKVLLKNGYWVEGIERDSFFMDGRFWNMIRFARIFQDS